MEVDPIMAQLTQSVIVDGTSSKPISILSSVPRGTVLGPLLYITDMISSTLCLFADDYNLY